VAEPDEVSIAMDWPHAASSERALDVEVVGHGSLQFVDGLGPQWVLLLPVESEVEVAEQAMIRQTAYSFHCPIPRRFEAQWVPPQAPSSAESTGCTAADRQGFRRPLGLPHDSWSAVVAATCCVERPDSESEGLSIEIERASDFEVVGSMPIVVEQSLYSVGGLAEVAATDHGSIHQKLTSFHLPVSPKHFHSGRPSVDR